MEEKEKKLSVLGWVIRIAALFAAVFFFFPFCTVSCSGQTVEITGKDITFGINVAGEYQSDGYIYFILLLLIPILVFALSFYKSAPIWIAMIAGSAVDLFLMVDFGGKLSKEVESFYCTAEYSTTFYFNVICHLLIIGSAGAFLLSNQSGTGNSGEKEYSKKVSAQDNDNNSSQTQGPRMKPAGRTYCTQCGEPLKVGAVFCTKCGNKLN